MHAMNGYICAEVIRKIREVWIKLITLALVFSTSTLPAVPPPATDPEFV
jgi:hypothetical protein